MAKEVVKINVGADPEVIELETFDFSEVAKEIGCDWIEPVKIELPNLHVVALTDEEGKQKNDFTYTGFIGGWNPLAGEVQVQTLVNTFVIAKTRKNKNGEEYFVGLTQKDMDKISERLLIVSDPRRGHNDPQVFVNFTNLSNEDLIKEMNK